MRDPFLCRSLSERNPQRLFFVQHRADPAAHNEQPIRKAVDVHLDERADGPLPFMLLKLHDVPF